MMYAVRATHCSLLPPPRPRVNVLAASQCVDTVTADPHSAKKSMVSSLLLAVVWFCGVRNVHASLYAAIGPSVNWTDAVNNYHRVMYTASKHQGNPIMSADRE